VPVEPRQYDPTRAKPGKELRGYDYIPELGDFVEVVNYEMPQDAALLAIAPNAHATGYSVIGAKITNERNSNKVRVEELRYPNRTTGGTDPEGDGNPQYPPQWEEVRECEELQEFVDRAIITNRLEDRDNEGLVEELDDTFAFREELRAYGPYHRKRTTWGPYGDEYLTRVHYDIDNVTGCPRSITRSVQFTPPVPSLDPIGRETTYKQVAASIWIKQVTQYLQPDGVSVISGSGPFVSYNYDTQIQFTFPSYIKPFVPAYDIVRTLNKHHRKTLFDIRIRTRKAFTRQVWAEKRVSYHAARPLKPNVFLWNYVDWKHDGLLFHVDIENVIADWTPISAVTLMNDTYYGAWNETVEFPASSPVTTLSYTGQIGIKTLVHCEIEQIQDRIFRKVETWVILG